jgi:hypothetical protein
VFTVGAKESKLLQSRRQAKGLGRF